MEAGVVGLVLVVLGVLLSQRLRWDVREATTLLAAAAVLFAFSLVAPIVGATEGEKGWIVVGAVAAAVGFLILLGAVLRFEPLGRRERETSGDEEAARKAAARRRRRRRQREERGSRVPDPFETDPPPPTPEPPDLP